MNPKLIEAEKNLAKYEDTDEKMLGYLEGVVDALEEQETQICSNCKFDNGNNQECEAGIGRFMRENFGCSEWRLK
jgi:hypothetical protein